MSKNKNHFMHPALSNGLACFRAIVKYGTIVTQIKGKVGGNIFQAGTAGMQFKSSGKLTKADAGRSGKLTKADAGRVIQAQANLGTTASAWRDLSDADKASWVAGAVNFPFKNKFGEAYTASGYQVFMSVNTSLLAINFSQRNDCPTPLVLPSSPSFTVEKDTVLPNTLDFTCRVPNDFSLILYACVTQSTGRNLTPGRLKAIRVFPPATYTGEDITDDYVAIFGTLPTTGNIWFQGVLVSNGSGQLCLPYTYQLQY